MRARQLRPRRRVRTLRGSRYTTIAGSERCSRAAHRTGCTADRMRSAPSPRATAGRPSTSNVSPSSGTGRIEHHADRHRFPPSPRGQVMVESSHMRPLPAHAPSRTHVMCRQDQRRSASVDPSLALSRRRRALQHQVTVTGARAARRAQRQPLARHPHLVAAAGLPADHLQGAAADPLAAAGAPARPMPRATAPAVPVVVVAHRRRLDRLRNRLQRTADRR